MVGYNEASEHHLSEFWQGIAGTCSGVLTRFLCQPLDVLKIRFQVLCDLYLPLASWLCKIANDEPLFLN